MAELKVHSRRESLPKELLYPLKTSALSEAFQQKLTGDLHLSVTFTRKQAYWKEQRERIQEEGRYKLARCTYYASGRHLPKLSNLPWSDEQWPQVVTAEVVAIPREVLPRRASIHAVTAALVREAVPVLAPRGLPMSRADAWLFELELDSTVHVVRLLLRPWTGGEFGLQTVERALSPDVPEAEEEPEIER